MLEARLHVGGWGSWFCNLQWHHSESLRLRFPLFLGLLFLLMWRDLFHLRLLIHYIFLRFHNLLHFCLLNYRRANITPNWDWWTICNIQPVYSHACTFEADLCDFGIFAALELIKNILQICVAFI
jgi:hypothetical protein